jgi:CRP-like cAMP-binding protein
MISPELLRKYPFFGSLDDNHLRELAMLAEEVIFESGEVIFQEGGPADALYFLLDGYVDLYYTLADTRAASPEKGIPVGDINPGEPFSISALIEPHVLTATASTAISSRVLKFDAQRLQALFKQDRKLAYALTYQAAKAAIERLHASRIQLAAAWA